MTLDDLQNYASARAQMNPSHSLAILGRYFLAQDEVIGGASIEEENMLMIDDIEQIINPGE